MICLLFRLLFGFSVFLIGLDKWALFLSQPYLSFYFRIIYITFSGTILRDDLVARVIYHWYHCTLPWLFLSRAFLIREKIYDNYHQLNPHWPFEIIQIVVTELTSGCRKAYIEIKKKKKRGESINKDWLFPISDDQAEQLLQMEIKS